MWWLLLYYLNDEDLRMLFDPTRRPISVCLSVEDRRMFLGLLRQYLNL
jgi:hypothetical protein